ncbi:hypothetical protein CVT25_011371 [Psilocybe cyanescens]|uniref:Uncharacterized protein n=1 Tax=Psilocybe cyanescens TaxID=93625 RepID=A0A409WGE6_PSICY|nr:hypothetical protein CVT25_011371 [Psilocybe cyanescens]
MNATKKRKLDSNQANDNGKRLKMSTSAVPGILPPSSMTVGTQPVAKVFASEMEKESSPQAEPIQMSNMDSIQLKEQERSNAAIPETAKNRKRINKLAPPRPFPTVPTSVSATGPRSSHREGKNMICLTRKTSLGAYMRRCKDVVLVDGYKTLHLSAMGAAIPLLTQLLCALPPILPYSQDEIHTEVTTSTVEVQDEVIPDDDDEDLTYQTRGKSVLRVVFRICDGEFEGDRFAIRKYSGGKSAGKNNGRPVGNGNGANKSKAIEKSSAIVYEEPEQEYMDML